MATKTKTELVSVKLDRELLRGIADEMEQIRASRPGRVTRADAVRSILHRQLRSKKSSRSKEDLYREMLTESGPLKARAIASLSEGYTSKARQQFLAAVVCEIEALAVLDDPSEETLRSTLIEVVGLLKDATGYRALPDVPMSRKQPERSTV